MADSSSIVQAEVGARTQALISRTLVLWELQQRGTLNLGHGEKGKLAEILGVSRPTLERSLAIIDESRAEVERLLRTIDPTYSSIRDQMTATAREQYARRDVPGVWVDGAAYATMLQLAGIDE